MTTSIPLRIFLLPHSPGNRREQQERTGYSIRALRPLDALCRQDFPSAAFRDGRTISSLPRYDHFDTSPSLFFSAHFLFAEHKEKPQIFIKRGSSLSEDPLIIREKQAVCQAFHALICRIYMRAYRTFVKRPRSVREMRSFIMCYSLGERCAAV